MSKTKVILADENTLFREGLKRILTSKKVDIVAQVSSIAKALETIQEFDGAIDLLLCDPASNARNEFESLRTMTRLYPGVKVILLTEQLNTRWLALAMETGACGFLPKDITAEALHLSMELALLGESISPIIHSLLGNRRAADERPGAGEPENAAPSSGRMAPLSSRESQVLSLIADGLPNKIIASDLGMAEATVKVHVKALMRKLNVQNRTQAAIWARNHVFPRDPGLLPAVNGRNGH
jgi:two-component system nitrate/nitrite response regulator NarL